MNPSTPIVHWPRLARLSLVVGAACLGPGCGDVGGTASADREVVPVVEAVPARSGSLPLVERLSGVARSANQVELRPEISGVVESVTVQSGAAVRAGEVLVRLRAGTEREQLAQAEATVRLTEASALAAEARVAELQAQVVRARALAAQALISDLELETREAQLAALQAVAAQERARVEQAQATAQERRTALDRMIIRAPIDGRVGRRNVEVGMRVDPGTLLFVLGSLDRLRVEVPLTEAMLSYLEVGQPVTLSAEGLGEQPVEAVLSRISPFLARGSFSTVAEIDVRNVGERIHPGMFLTVDIRYGESARATLVPTSALWEEPRTGAVHVFVVATDPTQGERPAAVGALSDQPLAIERRPVEIAAAGRGTAGIVGVEEGEWVVTIGQHLWADDDVRAARVRPTTWERVVELQQLQREDLLERFLEKQRRVARQRGAAPPSNAEYVGADVDRDPS